MTTESKLCLRIAVPVHMRQLFDYLPPEVGEWQHLKPGMRVKVPFQSRELVGIFMGFAHDSTVTYDKLKPIFEVLEESISIDASMMQLCQWAADYYHYPLGEVLAHAIPALSRKGKSLKAQKKIAWQYQSSEGAPLFQLNVAQQNAIDAVLADQHQFKVHVLNGVTGSGKTEVYLQIIEKILAAQKQVLVLVPEIGLTPQTIQRFRERFSVPIVALHSNITQKQKLIAFDAIQSNHAAIVIGTRSAIFSPFKNLGLIVVDEEHDASFKQQDTFRYHARDLAIMRAYFNHFPVVLGSATPSLETLFKAEQGKFNALSLPQRAGVAMLPQYELIDIRNQFLDEGLSKTLLDEMHAQLNAGNQVMLFLNRRGFAPVILCHSCGWIVNCHRCDARLTFHKQTKRLHCHHCDTQKFIPKSCDHCSAKNLIPVGMGTERLEEALLKHFQDFSIARIDRDTIQKKGAMEALLEGIHTKHYQILIGTQMLAKGHHFPDVTLVGIIDADGGFFSSDFRAIERMGQLLVQVAGRAGRVEKSGKVMIQTHHPDHPLLQQLFLENYQSFAKNLLQERASALLPPYAHFALFRAEAYRAEDANAFLEHVKQLKCLNGVDYFGPMPAPMLKRAGRYRAQLLLQTHARQQLQKELKEIILKVEKLPASRKIRWSLDVDPVEMF